MMGSHSHQLLPKNKRGSSGTMERALDVESKDLCIINLCELDDDHGHFCP